LLDIDEDGIQPLDDRERAGLVGCDQRALGEEGAPDPAADRSRNLGIAEADAGGLQLRPHLLDRRLGLPGRCDRVGIILLADGFARRQRLQPASNLRIASAVVMLTSVRVG